MPPLPILGANNKISIHIVNVNFSKVSRDTIRKFLNVVVAHIE
jgi:hypothetical protein